MILFLFLSVFEQAIDAVNVDTVEDSFSDEDPVEMDEPPQTSLLDASTTSSCHEKMSGFDDISRQSSGDSERYFLVHSTFLESLYSVIVCPICFTDQIHIGFSSDMGLACNVTISCKICKTSSWSSPTSPRIGNRHDVNLRLVLAAKECGIPLASLKKLLNIMNIPNVMHHKTFKDISLLVRKAATEAAEECMVSAADSIKDKYKNSEYTTNMVSPSGTCVVPTSYDGTWHKRGFSSHTGVGVAIHTDSGYVLDTHVVSNYCVICSKAPAKDSDEYPAWLAKHQNHNCNKNFEGTANAMETEAAEVIWSRSVANRGLMYGSMLCDGDSKALTRVNDLEVYDIQVVKEDCVNHIAKRIFNSLTTLKNNNKKQLNRKLTLAKMKKITNTYATNLRRRAPDIAAMKIDVMGGLFHMMSSDRDHNHKMCPLGATSWCAFNRAIAKGLPPPKHNPTITSDIGRLVFPIFKRLTEEDLLKRCAKMLTQNANESFNATIWRRADKGQFAHLPDVETAVSLAVLNFNMGPGGLAKVFEKLGISWSNTNDSFALKQAKTRVRHSQRKVKGLSKWKRKRLTAQQLQRQDKCAKKEGVTYAGGEFNF